MSYEDLTYPSLPLVQTHPERSATAATLLGMTPAPVDRCRVLELGCASGGNLLPMAVALPGSQFVGIDLSARQIAEGQALIAELGQRNIELRQGDLLALAAEASELGEFDYILCHGVYSWVPEPVQQAILSVCQRHLKPQGVAYVSYNTLPGFYRRQPIRDMMLFHIEQLEQSARVGRPDTPGLPPREAVRESRALVELLLQGVSDRASSWAHSLQEEADLLRSVPDGYLFHDHLEPDNRPCYFWQFAAAAGRAGLQFLSEAEPLPPLDSFPPAVQKRLAPFRSDIVVLEQYLDFLRNQPLRTTLLCRAAVPLTREPPRKRLLQLSVSCAMWPATDKPPPSTDIRSAAGVAFRSQKRRLTVTEPVMKAVLLALCEKDPQALSFADLSAQAAALLGKKIADEVLAELLLSGYRAGLLRLHTSPPRFALTISERPLASPLARLQAKTQSQVANLRHQLAELTPLEQQVLQKLDGEHDLPALRKLFPKQLEPTLNTLAGCALLLS